MRLARVILLLIGFGFTAILLSSCNKDNDFIDGYFHCKVIDDKNIAIGDISSDFSSDYVFVESEINGYTVTKLGFSSGLGFGGNGYLTSYKPDNDNTKGYNIVRFYCPNTICDIKSGYFKYCDNLNVFYCGSCINLGIASGFNIKWYVPSDLYDEFDEMFDNNFGTLFKANVIYNLNYEIDNKYYYVDNYEYGSEIEFIPPNPKRDGYEFIGWYKEEETINKWDFESDKLPSINEEEFIEIKLYAKWQEK